jgi:hypothetical protein
MRAMGLISVQFGPLPWKLLTSSHLSGKISEPTKVFQPRPRTSLAVNIVLVMHTTTRWNLSIRTMGPLSLFFLTNSLDVIEFQTLV